TRSGSSPEARGQTSSGRTTLLCHKKCLPTPITFCSMGPRTRRSLMKRWMFAAASVTLIVALWGHLPAVAQRASQPAAGEPITFEQYCDFRRHDVAQRQARLAQQL